MAEELKDKAQQLMPELKPLSIEDAAALVVTYQKPTDPELETINLIRHAAKEFIIVIAKRCPKGADRTAAIRKVREAMMTANASVVVMPVQF